MKNQILILSVFFIGCGQTLTKSTTSTKQESTTPSFASAKKILDKIYNDRRQTFYCNCSYSEDDQVNHQSCGYVPRTPGARADRIEWEHVVPAATFGGHLEAWVSGDPGCVTSSGNVYKGRRCAAKVSEEFQRMESDLYNLVPAVGEVNGRRSNYPMAEIPGEERLFGACDIEIANQQVEPRPEIRGNIARIYFYMDHQYPGNGIVSEEERKMFTLWDSHDPADVAECTLARQIEPLQGNTNPIVEAACTALKLRCTDGTTSNCRCNQYSYAGCCLNHDVAGCSGEK